MATENQSPTNEPLVESASQQSQGGDVGGALSENDFIRYFNDKHSAPKEAPAQKQAETEAGSEDDVVDLSELEDDSAAHEATEQSSDSNDTNASEEAESEAEPVFRIQVDGKTIEVKQSELIADAQKHRAATTKFDEASKMRKEADEDISFYRNERDSLKSVLAQYRNFMNEQVTARTPDWESLLRDDPLEYIRQEKYHQAMQQQLAQAQAYQENIKKQEELERQVAAEKHTKEQLSRAYEMFPHWKNPEVRQRDAKLMQAYLTEAGFTAAEQDGLNDARMLDVVLKAAKYDQAVKAKDQKKAKPSTGKTLTSNVSQSADPGFQKRQAQTANAREAKALQDRFKQNGDFDSFKAMFTNQMRTKR
ncbi:hypothetical protein AB4Y36_03490 [Paraburkholderia sp. BR10936]|uniref:hypothetical protein n=1 Tax=Paraburkholderia sp. BR10936 TaxID=3236993 RepID=UPI0034D1B60A